jgi:hypothetical protein
MTILWIRSHDRFLPCLRDSSDGTILIHHHHIGRNRSWLLIRNAMKFLFASCCLILNDVNHFKSYSNEFSCIYMFVCSFFVITLLPFVLRIFYCCYAQPSSLECIFEENIKKKKKNEAKCTERKKKKHGHVAIVWIESYDKKQQTTYDTKKFRSTADLSVAIIWLC